ncbi:Unknown protein [Striga hermonthica]|uniref:Uncharacterized protein n=1 Tax=Striga hermonthica TaxID=68872 RepID=A0A9N7R228_STRHE|nr:Unknown protein [Striga hermonthica]
MKIVSPPSGPGRDWRGSQPSGPGLLHGFCYNLCTAISSCFYVFCCCWLIEDCFVGRRSFPSRASPIYGSPEPPPPPPPYVGPGSQGMLGPLLGQSGHSHVGPEAHGIFGPPGPPGAVGYP